MAGTEVRLSARQAGLLIILVRRELASLEKRKTESWALGGEETGYLAGSILGRDIEELRSLLRTLED